MLKSDHPCMESMSYSIKATNEDIDEIDLAFYFILNPPVPLQPSKHRLYVDMYI